MRWIMLGVTLVGYLVLCAADPNGTCWWCAGYGTRRLRPWLPCRRCRGRCVRRRLGARLWGSDEE